jgi:hypothetical protein
VEESSYGLIGGTISSVAWKNWGKPENPLSVSGCSLSPGPPEYEWMQTTVPWHSVRASCEHRQYAWCFCAWILVLWNGKATLWSTDSSHPLSLLWNCWLLPCSLIHQTIHQPVFSGKTFEECRFQIFILCVPHCFTVTGLPSHRTADYILSWFLKMVDCVQEINPDHPPIFRPHMSSVIVEVAYVRFCHLEHYFMEPSDYFK